MIVYKLGSHHSEPRQIVGVNKRHTFVKSQRCRNRIGLRGPGREDRATTHLSIDGGRVSRLCIGMEGVKVQVHTIRVFKDSRDPILIQEHESGDTMTPHKRIRHAQLKLKTFRKTM